MLNAVQGPASGGSTDNAIVRWDGTTGRLVQNSIVTVSDTGQIAFSTGAGVVRCATGGNGMTVSGRVSTQATPSVTLNNDGASLSASTAIVQVVASVAATVAQTVTAGYKGLQVNITETTTGSGQKDLASLEVAGAQRWRCDNVGSSSACMQTAIPAGGTAGVGLKVSATANFGVFFGSGVPTLAAAKGSLYLRSDGTGTNDRMYVNTDGGTTWTAVVTAA